MNGWRRLVFFLPAALPIPVALDLGLAAQGGYLLRLAKTGLLAVEIGAIAGLFAVAWGLSRALAAALPPVRRWLDRLPAAALLTVAAGPVMLAQALQNPGLRTAGTSGLVVMVIAGVGLAEARGRNRSAVGILALLSGLSLAVIAVVLTASVSGAELEPPRHDTATREPATAQRPNLLLIVLDTLRADRLGTYGHQRPTSPFLDRWAEQATVFEHAIAPSSYTLPSHASLFTGLYPQSHGADVVGHNEVSESISLDSLGLHDDFAPVRPLQDTFVTLAELTEREGYETGAICANTSYLNRYFGLDQGFDTYVDARGSVESWRPVGLRLVFGLWRRLGGSQTSWLMRVRSANERYYLLAPEVRGLAESWVDERRNRPFFLFLNFMEPHAPNLPLGRYARLFPEAGRSTPDRAALPTEVLLDAYDAEIRLLDDQLALLFEKLDQWQLLEHTVVVIVGDHGESLGEHRLLGHAKSLYEPEVHVPLIVRLPGQTQGLRIDRSVSLVDVMPTVARLLELPTPAKPDGTDLFETLPEGAPRVPVVARLGPYERELEETAIYDANWKLISRTDGVRQLFDLRKDPGEMNDVAAAEEDRVLELSRELELATRALIPRYEGGVTEAPGEDVLDALRALGYVQDER